ncbi:MAG: diguanylate cyclase [Anaerolineaceae bacterium]|jgi:diguanylate cyclase (GGDEF)-like protein/PAS domain S-box-containing protein|nr:diguanylate cyclase [Anaerolineaceae bacterium]
MQFPANPIVFWTLLTAAAICSVLGFFSFNNRKTAHVPALPALLITTAIWNLSAAVSLFDLPVTIMNAAEVMKHLAAAVAATNTLAFGLQYFGRWKPRARLYIILLSFMPLLQFLFILTNPQHQLVWNTSVQQNLHLAPFGPWHFTLYTFNFSLITGTTALLFHTAITCPPIYRWQARLALFGIGASLLAYLLNFIYCADGIDNCFFLPLLTSVSGFVWFFASFRIHAARNQEIWEFDLLYNLKDGLLITNRDGSILYSNPAFLKQFRRKALQTLGVHAGKLIPEISSLLLQPPTLQPTIQEITWKGAYFQVQVQDLITLENEREGQFVTFTDITKLRQTEIAADVRKMKYRDIVEYQKDLITVWQPDTTIDFVNEAYCRYVNKSAEEVIGKQFFQNRPPETQAIIRDAINRLTMGEDSVVTEEYTFSTTNKKRWTQWAYLPIREADKLVAIQSVGRDITERKRIEEELRTSENRYRAVLDQQSEIVFRWQPDLKITFVNEAFCKFFGHSKENLIGENLLSVLPAADRPDLSQHLQKIKQDGFLQFESHETDHNGNKLWILWSNRAIYTKNRELIEIQSVGHDITDRKRAEQGERIAREIAETLRMINTELSRSLKTEEILNNILDLIAPLIPYDSANFLQVKGDVAVTTRGRGYEKFGGPAVSAAEGIQLNIKDIHNLSWMVENKQALCINDVQNASTWTKMDSLAYIKSWLGAPIFVQDKIAGFFSLDSAQPNFFTEDHLRYLNIFAGQVGLALENAHLYETARQRAREAETLQKVARVVNTSLNQQEIFKIILEQLERVIDYDSASILLKNDKGSQVVGGRGFGDLDAVLGIQFPHDDTTPNTVVLETREPFIMIDAPAQYAAFNKPPHRGIHGWMGVPLTIQDRVIGLLTIDSKQVGHFNEKHARLAAAFASQVAITIENARLFQETQRLSITDPLTNCYNRRFFFDQAGRERERSKRFDRTMSLIMLDLDHFKQVNDRFGHRAGDQVLIHLVQTIQSRLRTIDVLGRYGGEEFVILLLESSSEKAMAAAERIRQTIETRAIEIDQTNIHITASFGVVTYSPTEDPTIDELLDRADQAMYTAKRAGRNQVQLWKKPE